ncbi:O-antigen ligase family protein [Nitrobacteraceae bacterium UC4446_H13]
MIRSFPLPKVTTSILPADILIVLTAASLPWSTSLPAIFIGLWLLALIPIIDIGDLLTLAKRPICFLPIAFFGLALLGMLWSIAPWSLRLYAVGPLAKLLAIPLLVYHLQRSSRGGWIFIAFLISCTILMILSWIVAIEPRLALKSGAYYGVPVKNYIDQSHEFELCAIGLLYVILQRFRWRSYLEAGIFTIIAIGFTANLAFVVASRTALVTIPVLLALFAVSHLTRRSGAALASVTILLVAGLWFSSPNLRARSATFFSQYQAYEGSNAATSIGMRLEFWRKSISFFSEAPLIGHGTGSVRMLFTEAAAGQTGAAAEIISNPHNQTMYTAVQWGIIGVIVLYAMWIYHLLLFRGGGLANWIGLLIVAQNILTSLFNSHLFDFHPGWIYVLGVGVAGGMVTSIKTVSAYAPFGQKDRRG